MSLRLCGELFSLGSLLPGEKERKTVAIEKSDFFTSSRGEKASLYSLAVGDMKLAMSDFGATLVSVFAPAGKGRFEDLILGCARPEDWETTSAYFGATVGRYANRIGGARFSLGGKEYRLAANDGVNHLHGGPRGLSRRIWKVEPSEAAGSASLRFSIASPDGEEGYPGKLEVSATYTLSADGKLAIRYEARTDAPTVLNFTNHAYFNLHGDGKGLILDHELVLAASKYVEVGAGLIPTGRLLGVAGGPFDFRQGKAVGRDIGATLSGYDHSFVIDRPAEKLEAPSLFPFASLRDPVTGRRMEAFTTTPGVQFYSGNFLSGAGKGGASYAKHSGLCLETGFFPDSPNRPEFPSSVLNPGQLFRHETDYRFYY